MSRRLNAFEKAFIRASRVIGQAVYGYVVTFDEELVRQHGLTGLYRFGRVTQEAQNEIVDALGETRFHLLAAFASLWNGCDYCAYGHMLALNLCHLKETGELFPIDEKDVHELVRMRDADLRAALQERLANVNPDYLALLNRQLEVRFDEGPVRDERDRMILKSIALYEWVNECSITVEAPAPPLGPVAKDKELRKRYEAARAEARAKKAAAPAPATTES